MKEPASMSSVSINVTKTPCFHTGFWCTSHVVRAPAVCSAQSAALPKTSIADRSNFPILKQEVHGKPLIYLDSAATSQKPREVIEALLNYYRSDNSNVHRGAHSLAARATDAFEATRDTIAQFINAASRSEIVFTRNATEAINLVARTWGSVELKEGDEIVVSVMEHHANLVPWQIIAQEKGAVIVPVGLTEQQTYDVEKLRNALKSGKVKMVAFSHVSNVLGCINPTAEIIRLAHEVGAVTLVDACQSVPNMPVDVRVLDCDFLVASSHKMCGPTGVGFLYGKHELLNAMPPYMGGGEMIGDVYLDSSTYADVPHKFEAGTPAIGEIIAFGTAIRYLQQLGISDIHDFELQIGRYLYEQLSSFKEVTIYGPRPPRAPLCAFNVDGIHSSDLATILDLEGVAVRSGHHCAQPLHRELGITSSARASLYIYNTPAEVDAFIHSLQEAVELLGGSLTRR